VSHSDSIAPIREVIASLLGPEGCPWDKKQTPESLCDYIIEEAFELVAAIRSGDEDEAREELGDVLFLLLFVARLYEDRGAFRLEQAVEANAAKMIRRHPHVFDSLRLEDQDQLLKNWERIKRNEKKDENGAPAGVYDSLPKGLPPLLKAYRIHSKAARAGFTWETDQDVEEQLAAEWKEWRQARESGDAQRQEREFGDYLFTLAELGRRHGFKANAALDLANGKFLSRFQKMEAMAREQGQDLTALSLEEKNALWDKAKASE
jgi:ATP diphosphatase